MTRASRGWVIGPAVALALSVLASSILVAQQDQSRAEWRAMRDRLGTPAYDGAESDRRYDAAIEAMTRVQAGAAVAGLCAALLAAGAAARRARPAPVAATNAPPSSRRLRLATFVDAAVLVAGAALLRLPQPVLPPGWWDALAWLGGPLLLAVIAAPLAAGATPGQRLLRIATPGAGPLRALLAALLTPPAAVLALVPLRATAALHLRIAGVR